MPANTFFSAGKARIILPHAIFIAQRRGQCNRQNNLLILMPLCRQGHDQARRLRLRHSPPQSQGHAQERTSCADQPPLPVQPFSPACATPGEPTITRCGDESSGFHLPAPHQANPPSAQHSARAQERAETVRQGSLTVPFTARTSPVQSNPESGNLPQ